MKTKNNRDQEGFQHYLRQRNGRTQILKQSVEVKWNLKKNP